jgi:outer membrane protein assembly factor BamB
MRVLVPLTALILASAPLSGQVLYYDPMPIPEEDVLTQHNDNLRTGRAQTRDLSPANVTSGKFDYLFSMPVDGEVFAQPLYVSGLDMGQLGRAAPLRNVVFVATMKNQVYAFDANNSDTDVKGITKPLWRTDLGPAVDVDTELRAIGEGCNDIVHGASIGILATPVIDPGRRFLYVITKLMGYHFVIHKLDLRTGAVLINREIEGAVTEPLGAHAVFDPVHQLNRPGLLLTEGGKTILAAFGSHCDAHPFRGWVFAIDADTLSIRKIHVTTIQKGHRGGGIWQAGNGLATDPAEQNAFYMSGNGDWDDSDRGIDLPTSIVKLRLNRPTAPGEDWQADDWFTPENRGYLNNHDLDLGSSGVVIIPGKTLTYALGGGKEGSMYLANANNLTHFHDPENILQKFQAVISPPGRLCGWESSPWTTVTCHLHGSPVWWRPGGGDAIDFFVWGESDVLRGYRLHDSTHHIDTSAFATGEHPDCPSCMPGGVLALSSDQQRAGTGIVWATQPNDDALSGNVYGVLRAYDAATLRQIWRSEVFILGKYTPPTVAHDRVYIATHDNQVIAYGLRTESLCGSSQCGWVHNVLCGGCAPGHVCHYDTHLCDPKRDPCYHLCGPLPDGTMCPFNCPPGAVCDTDANVCTCRKSGEFESAHSLDGSLICTKIPTHGIGSDVPRSTAPPP